MKNVKNMVLFIQLFYLLKGQYRTIKGAWNRSASFRLTQWLKMMIRSLLPLLLHTIEPVIFQSIASILNSVTDYMLCLKSALVVTIVSLKKISTHTEMVITKNGRIVTQNLLGLKLTIV